MESLTELKKLIGDWDELSDRVLEARQGLDSAKSLYDKRIDDIRIIEQNINTWLLGNTLNPYHQDPVRFVYKNYVLVGDSDQEEVVIRKAEELK